MSEDVWDVSEKHRREEGCACPDFPYDADPECLRRSKPVVVTRGKLEDLEAKIARSGSEALSGEALRQAERAIDALLTMMDRGSKPRKFDEALAWIENDELARTLGREALEALRAARIEVDAYAPDLPAPSSEVETKTHTDGGGFFCRVCGQQEWVETADGVKHCRNPTCPASKVPTHPTEEADDAVD